MTRSISYPKKRYVRYVKSLRRVAASSRTLLDVFVDVFMCIRFKDAHHEEGLSRRTQYQRQPRLSVAQVIEHAKGTVQSVQSQFQSWIEWTYELFASQAVRAALVGFAAGLLLA